MSKRARWLRKRRRKGLLRPRPLRVMEANLDGASGGTRARAEARVRLRLKRSIKRGRPDVLTVCEASTAYGPVDLAAVIDRMGLTSVWAVSQDLSTAARSGSAVLWRRDRAEHATSRSRLGASQSLAGRVANRMRSRYIRRVALRIDPRTPRRWRVAVASAHAPPKRNWHPWGTSWWARVKTTRAAVKNADFNRLRRYVARQLPRRHVRMDGLIGITVARWIPTGPKQVIHIGPGHKAVVTTLWPKKKR